MSKNCACGCGRTTVFRFCRGHHVKVRHIAARIGKTKTANYLSAIGPLPLCACSCGKHKGDTGTARKRHFRKFGFSTLIIWEHEMHTPKHVVAKVQRFMGRDVSKD